jgi:MerR family transcriptional regulator, light-induced transcriptional regulator
MSTSLPAGVAAAVAAKIRQNSHELASRVAELHDQRQPETWKRYGQAGREKSVRDIAYHLQYLVEAIEAGDPVLFGAYLVWLLALFAGLNLPGDVVPVMLDCTRRVLAEYLPVGERDVALRILDTAARDLEYAPIEPQPYIQGMAPLDDLARRYLAALLRADRRTASQMIHEAVRAGVGVQAIYMQVFQRSLREAGRLWQINQIGVAEEHYCTAATQMIMAQLSPYIFTGERKERCIVVACVGGELHEIGAHMVADFFEMHGWDSHFLGANTPPDAILRAVAQRRADILALSATMTFHVSAVRTLIRQLRESAGPALPVAAAGIAAAHQTRVLVGGYPFNLSPGLWRAIGADGYAADADSAIREAERLVAR